MFGLPNLILNEHYIISSPQAHSYTCLAHTVYREDRVIWPDEDETCAWPLELPRRETLDVFKNFFHLCGYFPSEDGRQEEGIEKVALYTDNLGLVKHASRQLLNGHWSSKLGILADIEHSDEKTIEGEAYGSVTAYMGRAITGNPPILPALHPPLAPPRIII